MKKRLPETSEPNEGIELLYTRDCQAWPEALEHLKAALKQLEIPEELRLIPVDTMEQAEIHNFFASPTIHLGGVDIDPKARRISKRALGLNRPYFYNGRAHVAPPVELIVEGLRELYLGAGAP